MKKNISINISGIIFHIEEDGYENLRKYLDSINKYFSSFDDSSEILADIESRIAEIFLSKLNEGKQVITADDVNSLITTMGSVSDFKAAEEPEFVHSEHSAEQTSSSNQSQSQKSFVPPKQLMRDQKRKILGGVCAGLGSHFNIDPVWIRLVFAVLTFAYGITILAYIIMWIVVPGSYDLEEPEVKKKLYRDPQRKVIAGVSGGLASFINIDIIAVRVLFIILTVVGGMGLLIYLVLWAILPEAKTLTDKMQMQGEPVTLSNIESNIKKNQSITGQEEESTLTKILLFPFRLIGLIITTLAKILMPLIDVIRVALGILVTLLGASLVFALIVIGGFLIGLFSGVALPGSLDSEMNEIGFPIEVFTSTFPTITTVSAFIVAVIPCIFIILLGISIIGKRIVFAAPVGWSLFVLFFGGLAVLGFTVPRIIHSFKENGEYKIESSYLPTGKKLILKVNDAGLEDYHAVNLTLKGYDKKEIKLIQTFEAQGSTRRNAVENAQMVEYNVDFKDSILTFDNNIQFKKDAKFRGQQLYLTLYIPYEMSFVMDEEVSRFVSHYINSEDLDGYTWQMSPKGLDCIDCPEHVRGENDKDFDLTDFNELDISGAVDITITRGDQYAVDVVGYAIDVAGRENEKDNYAIYKRGNTLVINFENQHKSFWKKKLDWDEIKINITMPELEKIEAKGAGNIRFNDFTSEDMEISVFGAVNVHGDVHVQNLRVNITGASEVELLGDSKNMEASIQGASSLNAYKLDVVDADVEVVGASHANVNVSGTLEMTEGVASDIDYRGNPNVIRRD